MKKTFFSASFFTVLASVFIIASLLFLPRVQSISSYSPYEEQGVSVQCRPLIKGHAGSENNDKINIVFVGYHFDDVNSLLKIAKKIVNFSGLAYRIGKREYFTNDVQKIYGLLGTEPFKSNKSIFNFWYIDKIYTNEEAKEQRVCPQHPKEIDSFCPSANRYFINLCNYHTNIGGAASQEGDVVMTVTDENNKFDPANIGLINHELGGHILGQLPHPLPNSLVFSSDFSLCYNSFSEAKDAIGDLFGAGCGLPNKVDCREDCLKKHMCSADEYRREVQFIVTEPVRCFDDTKRPILGCSLDLERATVPSGGGLGTC